MVYYPGKTIQSKSTFIVLCEIHCDRVLRGYLGGTEKVPGQNNKGKK